MYELYFFLYTFHLWGLNDVVLSASSPIALQPAGFVTSPHKSPLQSWEYVQISLLMQRRCPVQYRLVFLVRNLIQHCEFFVSYLNVLNILCDETHFIILICLSILTITFKPFFCLFKCRKSVMLTRFSTSHMRWYYNSVTCPDDGNMLSKCVRVVTRM
jgi:hypothetical protein